MGLALIVLAAGGPAAAAGARLALVIGNSAYENTSPLANPANDSRLIAETLRRVGFAVDEHHDLTQKKLKRAIAAFTSKVRAAGRGAIAVIYYAGHGLRVGGVNYMVPVDALIDKAGDVPIESVSAANMLASLEDAGAGVNIIILDACRNNPFKAASRSMSRGLARMEAPTGSIIAYATSPGQVAADGDGANSPYASALARHLASPGLAIEQVFKKVRIDVRRQTGNKQTPWEESSLTRDVFLSGGPAGAAASPTPTPTPATPQPSRNQLGETAYLKAVRDNSMAAYEGFLARFPNHPRAANVRRLMASLADEAAWKKATRAHSLAAYRRYLLAFPQGQFSARARQQISALEAASAPQPAPQAQPQQPTQSAAPSCQQLWVQRNSIFRNRGYCFKTARAKRYFGNAGCWTSNPRLTRAERARVQRLLALERRYGCR